MGGRLIQPQYLSTDPAAGGWTPTPPAGGGITVNGQPGTPTASQLPQGTKSTDPNGNVTVWNGTAWVPFQGSSYDSTLNGTAPPPGSPAAPGGAPPSTAATTPSATGGAYTGSPTDVNAFLAWLAQQPGHDPILDTPGGIAYYTNAINTNGGLNASNTSYWQNKGTLASSGGAVGAGGGTGSGSLVNTVPSEADAMKLPGYQFAFDQGQRAVQTSAAAKGDLLTGGTLKDLATYGSGQALNQSYLPLAALNLGYNQANVGNLFQLANYGQTGSATGAA